MAVHRVPIPNYTSSAEGSSPPPSSLGQSLGGGVNFPSTTNRTPTSNANSKMSAFRPQGRLPLDPFSTATTEVGGPSGGTTATGSRKEKGRPFHWTITGEDVQEVWQRCKFEQGKVILVLGAPSERDLGPLLSSQLLTKSLVIIATKQPPSKLFLSTHGPAFVILRLQPYSLSGPSAQQQLHSILTRAGDVAHRWRKDRQSFFDSESLRGRSKQRKQSKSTEAAQIRAVQFSELGGVFGGAFVVKEDVGYDPDASTVSASSKPRPKRFLQPKKLRLAINVFLTR
ncbi:hypothetical protein BT96DRAFT_410860 [Gymnopus androsaceus JB14]|uniref:Uncharacterized protein n=1 Tax=Gymnopus androsaceus JB14 TaxID=1447944 RepID=A0A6A4I7A2_9AGAR|nr:hypothetical protein BT96DRAFT_410860 [Gymnopus androsaceus JB14]